MMEKKVNKTKTIESMLRDESYQLKRMEEETIRRLKTAPMGSLRIRKWNGVVEYYYRNVDADNVSERSNNGRYLKKSEEDLARRIAQRDYDIRVIKQVQERIKAINTFLKIYETTSLKMLYTKIHPYRRKLISPMILSDEEYIKQWQAVEYKGKPFSEDEPEIITERGERVRSKSEKIIADKLYILGIPYRYEYPIMLEGNIKIYPDFTIFRMPQRDEVYLEHFGMMDDSSYVEKVMYKLNTYERNGIYLGVNLFITHESVRNPLNTKVLDRLIRKLFCE